MKHGYMSDPTSIEVRELVGNKIWKHIFDQNDRFLVCTRNDSCVDAWIAAKFLGWNKQGLELKIKEYLHNRFRSNLGDEAFGVPQREEDEWVKANMNLLEEHIDRIEPYAEHWDDVGMLLDKMVDEVFAHKLRNYIELMDE